MTDTRTNNATMRELPLAAGGDLELRLGSNRLRLRVVDGDRVVIRGDTDHDLERDIEIETGTGWVRVSDGPVGSLRFGPLTVRNGGRVPDLEVDVPRNVRISARTLSGDIDAVGVAGPTRWQTASGTIRIGADAGPVSIDSISGDAFVQARSSLAVTCRTVSGNVKVWAPSITALDVATTSGNVAIDAALEAGAGHTITSVSGDVRLATGSEVTVELQSVTGDIRATGAHRTEGTRGRRSVIVGSGQVRVGVRTMSGDVEVRPGLSVDAAVPDGAAAAPAGGGASFSAEFRRDWNSAAKDWAQWGKAWAQWGKAWAEGLASGRTWTADPASRGGAWDVPASPEPQSVPPQGAPPAPPEPDLDVTAPEDAARPSGLTADEPGPDGDRLDETSPAPTPGPGDIEAARLEVLRQLERGELDVEAAAARLSSLEAIVRETEG